MIRTAIFAAFLGGMAYLALFVDLGGKSLVGHFQEVWAAPIVQKKLEEIRGGVKANIAKKLKEGADKAGKAAATGVGKAVKDEITDTDRAEMFEVLKKAGVRP
jgi:hypothetical protein